MSRHLSISVRNVFLALLLIPAAGFAQGLIQGTVYDPNGGAITNTKIILTQPSTGLTRTATSDAQGSYIIPAVPPASYNMDAQAPGFRPSHLQGITALADQNLTVNIQMQVGDASQAVTVEAGAVPRRRRSTHHATRGEVDFLIK